MRHCYQGTFKDQNGAVVGSSTTSDGNPGTVTVYLAGGTTLASVYTASAGGTAVNSVTTDAYGYFYFWVDATEYTYGQLFKIVMTHSDFVARTYDNLDIVLSKYDKNDVTYWGALGDGTTDDRAAFNAAIADMDAGDTLTIPVSSSYYKITDYITVDKSINILLLGEVRSTDSTKVLFQVTANGVTFDGTGTLSGPGTFQQGAATGTAYGALIKFLGTNTTTGVIKNSVVRNINIVNPPWSGIYFLYAKDSVVSGVHFKGGPTTYTSTNHFDILGIDSYATSILDNFSIAGDDGGQCIQFFCNSNSAITYTPCIVRGNTVRDSWEKLIYQNSGGAQVIGNRAWSRTATDNKHLVQTGSLHSTISDNILQGSIAAFGASGAIITNNIVYDYTYVGIHLGMKTEADTTFEKTIIADNVITSEAGATHVYEAIRISSDTDVTAYDVTDVIVRGNIITNADSTEAASLGAISVTANGSGKYARRIKIIDNIIITPGQYGIVASNIHSCDFIGNVIKNPGAGAAAGYGIWITTYAVGNTFKGNRFFDYRTGAEILVDGIVNYGVGTYQNNIYNDNRGFGFTGTILNVGDTFGATTLAQVKDNAQSLVPLYGTFTLDADAATTVANTAIYHATYPKILLVPVNASAFVLQGGANAIYVSGISAKTSFTVSTAGGGNAAGTEIFYYEIIQ